MNVLNQADALSDVAVELYDTIHRGNGGDVGFYVGLCQGVRRVVEFGVGTGRIALALARAGTEVVGVELDSAMLQRARENLALEPAAVRERVTLVAGDMRDVQLNGLFDRVLIPYNALLCLLNPDDTSLCFANARRLLVPNGKLVFDVYRADELHHSDEEDDRAHGSFLFDEEALVRIEQEGISLRVFEANRWIRETQRMDTAYRFQRDTGEVVHEQLIKQRYLLGSELQRLLTQAGFRVLQHRGGFGGEPATEDAIHHVVVAGQRGEGA